MRALEYVASGTSHTRILANAVLENPDVVEVINSYFSGLNGKNNHHFSLLFNAFTEKEFGKKFQDLYAKSLYTVHADSGGLQIITQGKTITPELKDGVYTTQAKYSDVAMCFDEIPVTTIKETSNRNDTTGRLFDKDNLEYYARLTGKNIKRQIEIILDEKSKTKPMIIAQGNCYDTYMQWVEYILKEIPSSYHKHIGGIAMGAAALGTGPLEDIERAAYATQLPFQMDEPYIHILGVGSVRRLLPYIALAKSGYYPENLHLSYDSTTHTSGVSMGLYHSKDGGMSINRVFSDDYNHLYDDINSKYDLASKGIDVIGFHKMINSNSTYYYDKKREVVDKDKMIMYYHTLLAYICSSISNFTADISSASKSKSKLIELAEKNRVPMEICYIVNNVKNIDDFKHWYYTFGNSTKSKRITADMATLGDLFFN